MAKYIIEPIWGKIILCLGILFIMKTQLLIFFENRSIYRDLNCILLLYYILLLNFYAKMVYTTYRTKYSNRTILLFEKYLYVHRIIVKIIIIIRFFL